jgi:salicylate hydroxylase
MYSSRDVIREILAELSGGALRIHRADFQLSLLRQLPLPASGVAVNSTCKLHLSHKLIDYQITSHSSAGDPRPITLFFADKSNKTCDMLVGADGIKSTVRQLFLSRLPNPEKYEMFLDPVWSGTVAYRGLVDKAELKKVFPGHRALDHPGIMVSTQ